MSWWVAPTFAQSKMAYQLVKRLLPKDTYIEKVADMKIILLRPDGSEHSTIEFKSGDNPDSLRGFGVHFFIVDEAARVPLDSMVSVMTTVTQTFGKGIIISTPNGRGWFYDWYQRGEKFFDDGTPKYDNPDDDPWAEWFAIRMPTWSNPHVKLEAIKQFRKNLPDDVFRQEVAAQFLLDSAGVFRGIKDCVRGEFQSYTPGHRYVMGVDLARLRDYSVLVVMDQTQQHVVAFDRFNKTSWEYQYGRIIEMARRYKCTVCIDSTGVGDPIVENIMRSGVRVVPYKIGGSEAKKRLIDKLRLNIEHAKISFPHIPVLRRELENYEYQISESGVVKYSAPSGQHDDCMPAGTLIRTKRGMVPIESVVVGDEVLTHVGRYRKVTALGQRFADYVYKVKATGRPEFCLTGNHRFYAYKAGTDWKRGNTVVYTDPTWVCVDDGHDLSRLGTSSVAPSDVVDVECVDMLEHAPDTYYDVDGILMAKTYGGTRINPKQNPLRRFIDVDDDFCRMLGYYAAEGAAGKHNVGWASHLREQAIRDWLISYLRRLGLNPTELRTSDNGCVVSAGSVPLNRWFKANFGKFNHKRLPVWVETLPLDKQKQVLWGYFLGDGCFSDGVLVSASISPTLAVQVYEMAIRCGLMCSLNRYPKKGTGKHDQWWVSFGRPTTQKIIEMIGPELMSAKLTCDVVVSSDQTQLKKIGVHCVGRVRSVEKVPHNGVVYNMDVEEDHSYVANGTVVHNCVISLALSNWICDVEPCVYKHRSVRGI